MVEGFIENLIHHHDIPHSFASDQGAQSDTYAIHWSYHLPHNPEPAVRIER